MERPDFSGHWRLDVAASRFGFLKPPRSREDRIEHRDLRWRMVTRQVDTNGDHTVERLLTLDGAETCVEVLGTPRRYRAGWNADAVWIECRWEVSGRERRLREHWRLADSGEIVRIERRYEQTGGAVRQQLYLRRVPPGGPAMVSSGCLQPPPA
jgi:hypothetical protein